MKSKMVFRIFGNKMVRLFRAAANIFPAAGKNTVISAKTYCKGGETRLFISTIQTFSKEVFS
jgi:hypothetical protein